MWKLNNKITQIRLKIIKANKDINHFRQFSTKFKNNYIVSKWKKVSKLKNRIENIQMSWCSKSFSDEEVLVINNVLNCFARYFVMEWLYRKLDPHGKLTENIRTQETIQILSE
jgi:hypothetical protein